MFNLLVAVLVVAAASLVLNALFIAHELGWFPHGKRRDRPDVRRQKRAGGRIPTIEEARYNDDDSQVKSHLTDRLRQYAHAKVYEYSDPEAQLREVLARFKAEPTPSHRDDVLNLMNHVTTTRELTESLDAIVEQGIRLTSELDPEGSKEA